MRTLAFGIALAAAVALPALADTIRVVPVHFARGASSTVLTGSVRGYDSVDFAIAARAGQTLSVRMRTANGSNYFNVLPPKGDTALYDSAMGENAWSGRFPETGLTAL